MAATMARTSGRVPPGPDLGPDNLFELFTGPQVPDPITFMIGEQWLDRGNLYPRQVTLLKLFFLRDDLFTDYDRMVIDEWIASFASTGWNGIQTDVHRRVQMLKADGYRWFREILLVMGRRAGKGHISALAFAYVLWNYLAKGDPQGHYGVDRDKQLALFIFAGKKDQAKANLFGDVYNVVTGGPCFSPYISQAIVESISIYAPHDFLRMRQRSVRGIKTTRDPATFVIQPKESTLMAGRGPASFCLDPETPVLRSDLTWVPIKELSPGDRVVGLDERPLNPRSQRKLRDAEVEKIWWTRKSALRLMFDDGSEVVCSPDHKWLKPDKMQGGGTSKWCEARRLKPGNRIRHLADPWEYDESRDAGYLAGMFDGEGCLPDYKRRGGGSELFISQNPNEALDEVMRCLKVKGFTPVPHGSGAYRRSEDYLCQQWGLRGIGECMRFLGSIRPPRLIGKQKRLWEGASLRGGLSPTGRQIGLGFKTIVQIEDLPEQDLVDIQTSTRTFIANGLISHNCLGFDEMAHVVASGANRNAGDIYNSTTPSLDQFGKDAFIIAPSSPWQKAGQFYENYKQALELDEQGGPVYAERLMVQLQSWDIYKDWEIAHEIDLFPPGFEGDLGEYADGLLPRLRSLKGAIQTYDLPMQRLERANPDTFRVERRSQWAAVMDAYLNENKVDQIFQPWMGRVESHGTPHLQMQESGLLVQTYKAHADPSKSNCNFGFALAHAEPDADGVLHCVFDKIRHWEPQQWEDGIVDYDEIADYLVDDIAHKFYPDEITFDQFNCLDAGTLVPTDQGLLTMEEIAGELDIDQVRDPQISVQTMDGVAMAGQVFRRGKAQSLRLVTKHGVELICTPEHRVWVRKAKDKPWHPDNPWEWLTAEEIGLRDHVRLGLGSQGAAEPLNISGLHPRRSGTSQHLGVSWDGWKWVATAHVNGRTARLGRYDDEGEAASVAQRHRERHPTPFSVRRYPERLEGPLARVLGLLVAEGNVERRSSAIGNKDREVLDVLASDLAQTFGGSFSYRYHAGTWEGRYHYGVLQMPDTVTAFFKALGADDVRSQEKVVPWSVRRSPREVQAEFLRGLFEGDAGVTLAGKNGEWVYFTTTSETLGVQVQQMLHAMGVLTTRWAGRHPYKGERRRQWRIKVCGPALPRFREQVGFLCSRKTALLDEACDAVLARGDRAGRRDANVSGDGWYFDRIVSIEDVGFRECYDLAVPGPHNFVANGIITHNSVATIQKINKALLKHPGPKRVTAYERTATKELNWSRAEVFKTAINMGLVHAPYYELAENELKFLIDKGNKVVDHPDSGPVRTKDVADCMFECVYYFLGKQIQVMLEEMGKQRIYGGLQGGTLRIQKTPQTQMPSPHDMFSDFGTSRRAGSRQMGGLARGFRRS